MNGASLQHPRLCHSWTSTNEVLVPLSHTTLCTPGKARDALKRAEVVAEEAKQAGSLSRSVKASSIPREVFRHESLQIRQIHTLRPDGVTEAQLDGKVLPPLPKTKESQGKP